MRALSTAFFAAALFCTASIYSQNSSLQPGQIKLVILAVEGALTGEVLYFSSGGDLIQSFSIKDLNAIKQLKQNGISVAVISKHNGGVIGTIAQNYQIDSVETNVSNVLSTINTIASNQNCDLNQIAYMGFDKNDVAALGQVGLAACPQNADQSVVQASTFIAPHTGGNGAIADLVTYLNSLQT